MWLFAGIPYAQPPTGPLRFMPPRPHRGWTGQLDATRFGPEAPQARRTTFTRIAPPLEQHEDCLTLNVFTPGTTGPARPVLVWLHPGSFMDGAGSRVDYDGAGLARHGDVVVVTCNYRLGVLGWLDLSGHDPGLTPAGTNGLLDQVAVLTWVRDHIASLGGDPGAVTVFGSSSGAMSVAALMAAPAAAGLFHRAILQSGAARYLRTRDQAVELTDRFLHQAGARRAGDLVGIDADHLIEAQSRLVAEFFHRQSVQATMETFLPFGPVIGDELLPEHPMTVLREGRGRRIPMIVGTNHAEFASLGVRAPVDSTASLGRWLQGLVGDHADRILAFYTDLAAGDPHRLAVELQTDRLFRVPASRLADAHARHVPDGTHRYLFVWDGGGHGACHGVELPFVFDHLLPWQHGWSGLLVGVRPPSSLGAAIHRAWLGFAGSSAVAPLLAWPPAGPDRTTMLFDVASRVASDPYRDRVQIWDGVV